MIRLDSRKSPRPKTGVYTRSSSSVNREYPVILRLCDVAVPRQSELETALGERAGERLRDDSFTDGVKRQFRNAFQV
jgi:hypothetical protein